MQMSNYPIDARGNETLECFVPFTEEHLTRFFHIALEDMDRFFEQRPELEKHRFAIVLAESAADHYVHETGFRCISLFTFFKKAVECKDFHPLRHTRVDFGSAVFGRSSWVKHPGDQGFVGRGVNCFGRSIPFFADDTVHSALTRYLQEGKSQTAASLKEHSIVLLWPEKHFGEILN